MRGSRALAVAGGCTAIIGAGWLVAPTGGAEPGFLDPGGDPPPDPTDGQQVFEGPVVTNIKGRYQVEISVADGVVTDVHALEAGTPAPESVGINTRAIPLLEERILEAQTWDVEYVSGASFSSPAIIESARGAFEAAGLG